MAGAELLMVTLHAGPLTAAGFASFGQVISTNAAVPEMINDGSTRRYSDLATLDLCRAGKEPVLGIYVAQARHFPLPVTRLERHSEACQVFLPLGMQRFIVVVAAGMDRPDWNEVQAFLTEPGQGVSIGRGCWHHGLIALSDGDRFAVVEGGNYRRDTVEVPAPVQITLLHPEYR